ncbi:MAG: hypothetical protein BGO43_05120 [Gammaproteobacteria bacterium 39-13]|nr:ankyrin repeat domain-containing protein [Gammaproteobacteria bacterium]OJV96231.1 MAG: hypothetical protein BGO43_05120 [Gammaproteobacteria bacterium 39-13]
MQHSGPRASHAQVRLNDNSLMLLKGMEYLLSGQEEKALALFKRKPFLLNNIDKSMPITPLMAAASKEHPCCIETFTWILQRTQNINHSTNTGNSIIHWLANLNYHVFLSTLLAKRKSDIKINQLTNNKESPTFIACYSGSLESLQLFIDAGANIHIPNAQGTTPLQIACAQGHACCVELLLRHGALIEQCDYEGKNAFHYLALSQSVEILNLLMQANEAGLKVKTKKGNLPFEIVLNQGHENFATLLKKQTENVPNLKKICANAICFHFKNEDRSFREVFANQLSCLPLEVIEYIENIWRLKARRNSK